MPHLDPRSLEPLSLWCRRWLRVNATLRHVKKQGSNTRHQSWYSRRMQQMPLEVHAFLHHAVVRRGMATRHPPTRAAT